MINKNIYGNKIISKYYAFNMYAYNLCIYKTYKNNLIYFFLITK